MDKVVMDEEYRSNDHRSIDRQSTDRYSDTESQILSEKQIMINNLVITTQTMTQSMINGLISSTYRVWKMMYDNHISILDKDNSFIIKKKIKLTRYVDYAKKIRDSSIQTPDWFILSSGSVLQTIIPCYDVVLDPTAIALIEKLYPSDPDKKTMAVYHMSKGMTRLGMHVSDVISRNIFKIFSNMYSLNYVRTFITSPEECFMIRDHYASYYEHIKYGLLNRYISRMFLISTRQITMIVNIIMDVKSLFVDELMLIDPKRGKEVQSILYDESYEDGKHLFKALWPDLKLIVTMYDGDFHLSTVHVRKIVDDIQLYCPVLWIPENIIGYDLDVDGTYVIDPRKAYYEFLALSGEEDTVKGIRELKIGEMYNIVISSSSSGFVRYITGLIVRVISYYNRSPKIEPICRESDLIKLDGRTYTPKQIEDILLKDLPVVNFCYRYGQKTQDVLRSNKMKLYIELEKSSYVGDEYMYYDVKQKIKDIDLCTYLKEELDIYFEVRIIKPGTFDLLYKNRYSDEVDPATVQVPKLITNTFDTDVLRNSIMFMYNA